MGNAPLQVQMISHLGSPRKLPPCRFLRQNFACYELLGIVSMKERVLLVQGEFSIYSQPGQGTTFEIFVPLSREAI
jgi:hypothetical protein